LIQDKREVVCSPVVCRLSSRRWQEKELDVSLV
jgi:hypothetical protein